MSDLIFVINNELQSVAPPSIKDFCMTSPRGAYTTLQISKDFLAIDFDLHIERLIKSIAAVHAKLDSCYANYYTALDAQDSLAGSASEAGFLQAALLPSLLLALTEAGSRYGHQTPKIATLVVSPSTLTATSSLSLYSLNIHVAVAQNHPRPPRSVKPSENNNNNSNAGTFAVILGPPRDVPIGKDSGWVAQRQSLEALRPDGAAEVLLTTHNGKLLEGLVTNVYIITVVLDEQGKEEIVLQTAGMDDGVVWGTLRKRVLQACEELKLKVVEDAPAAGERDEREMWQEAFLTNALRGVQPLHRIECDARNVWGLQPWKVEFAEVPGSWTAKIQARVEASLKYTDLQKLSSLPP